MNKIFRLVAFSVGLALVHEASLAQQCLVYRHYSLERPFVVSRYFAEPTSECEVSQVIEARTFTTEVVGAVTEVTLSNAVMFAAEIPPNSAANSDAKIKQYVASFDKLVLRLQSGEKIVQCVLGGPGNQPAAVPEQDLVTNGVQFIPPPPEPKN